MNNFIPANSPILSVVIPCFNQGEYLLDAISSVRAYTDSVYEIIIVNDGSTDAMTIDLMQQLEQQGYLVLNQENQGVARARNNAIEQAQGRYILALDADNKIRLDYILKGIEILDRHPDVGVVYGKPEWFGEGQRSWHIPEEFDVDKLIIDNYIDACAVFRKSLWQDCGGYDPELLGLEDWDFWLSAVEKGWKFYYIPEILFDYRVRSGSRLAQSFLSENRGRIVEYICLKHASLYDTHFPKMIRDREEKIGNLLDWVRNLETQHSSLLARSQSELQQTHDALDRSQSELQQTLNALESSQSELHQTNDRLVQSECRLQQTSDNLAKSQSQLQQTTLTIQWMETSKFWRLRLAWLKFRDQLKTLNFLSNRPATLPAEIASILKHLAPAIATNSDESYSRWRSQNVPRLADLDKLAETIELLPSKPLISAIVPVFNTPEPFLRAAIESVIAQIYPHWELCIADDCSTQPHIRQVLAEYQARDSRIKVKFRETNGHISNSSNSALELATGDFVALLDHDDLLTPDAFYEVALLLNRHPEADMIYSDEDKIDEQGQLKEPFFKPDWCPDSFLSRMYTCHLGVYRRSLISAINGFRPGFEGSQDYDLVLRVTEKTKNIFHIPKILYHWRIHSQSVASGSEAKPYAYQAAEKALNEALIRRQELGQVIGVPGYLGHYCIRYALPSHPRISIIIPTRDLSVDLDKCLASIFTKSTYSNYEVLVIDNNSVEASTAEVLDRWTKTEPTRFRHLAFKQPFNFSKLNNYAVSNTQSELIVFLNNDTEVITPDWLEAMAEQAQRPTIGAVGCLLLYPNETIQHAGIVLGLGGVAGHGNHYASSSNPGYFGQLISISNFSAVTAACLMCRREVFDEVGGFDEVLSIAFNDVDLCLKMKQAGYHNVYLPHARLYHYESKSRGYENTTEKQLRFKQETAHIRNKWGDSINNDPCYNPHLSRTSSDYSLNV
ncbi:MAG: hypothetical protein RLZZ135_386 [Cyanobacteriota bacterium]|jgi:glycosyltransferase involved in cell wall biosynthesis